MSEEVIDQVAAEEETELKRRERLYRGERPPLEVRARTVILVDDGVATGATMRAGIAALRQRKPERLIVAVPTAAPDTYAELTREVDEVIALTTPEPYIAVGVWYRHFPQISEKEVQALLEEAAQAHMAVSS
jgi:putative phosphoribosyl transferase